MATGPSPYPACCATPTIDAPAGLTASKRDGEAARKALEAEQVSVRGRVEHVVELRHRRRALLGTPVAYYEGSFGSVSACVNTQNEWGLSTPQ